MWCFYDVHVIVPSKFQHWVLEIMHNSCPDINEMKLLARSCCWWPGVDQGIQKLVKSCISYQSVIPTQTVLSHCLLKLCHWIQFAGPLERHIYMYFIIIDLHSKWTEIYELTNIAIVPSSEVLHRVFSVLDCQSS